MFYCHSFYMITIPPPVLLTLYIWPGTVKWAILMSIGL